MKGFFCILSSDVFFLTCVLYCALFIILLVSKLLNFLLDSLVPVCAIT